MGGLKYKMSLVLSFADGVPGLFFYIMLYPQHLMEKLDLIPFTLFFPPKYNVSGEMDHIN